MSVSIELEKVRAILEHLHQLGMDDPELKLDTLEGETDLFEIIDWALGKEADEQCMQDAIAARMEDLAARKKASVNRAVSLRGILEMCLTAADEKSLRRPEATITLSAKKQAIQSVDESLLPDRFWRMKREPDRTAIREALEHGEAVQGVLMDNGGQTLTIRRK